MGLAPERVERWRCPDRLALEVLLGVRSRWVTTMSLEKVGLAGTVPLAVVFSIAAPFALISQVLGSIIRYMQDRTMSIVMRDMDHYDEMWMISGKMTGSILKCAMSIIW